MAAITPKDRALCREAIMRTPGLPSAAKSVAYELIGHASDKGEVWLSEARLAEIVGVTTRTVRAAKTLLKKLGFITWRQRGRHQTPLYQIAWNRLKALAAIIKRRVARAAMPYRKPQSPQPQPERKRTSAYLSPIGKVLKNVVEKAGQMHKCTTAAVLKPQKIEPEADLLLNQRAHSRLQSALMAIREPYGGQIRARITEPMEAQAVKAERNAPGTGFETLLWLIRQGNSA